MTIELKRRRWLAPTAGLIVLVGGVLYLFLGDTGVRQGLRLRALREHLPSMNRHLAQSPKYVHVKAQLYTGRGGSMKLVGTVANEDDYWDLLPYAQSLKAPVRILQCVTLPDGRIPDPPSVDHSPEGDAWKLEAN